MLMQSSRNTHGERHAPVRPEQEVKETRPRLLVRRENTEEMDGGEGDDRVNEEFHCTSPSLLSSFFR